MWPFTKPPPPPLPQLPPKTPYEIWMERGCYLLEEAKKIEMSGFKDIKNDCPNLGGRKYQEAKQIANEAYKVFKEAPKLKQEFEPEVPFPDTVTPYRD